MSEISQAAREFAVQNSGWSDQQKQDALAGKLDHYERIKLFQRAIDHGYALAREQAAKVATGFLVGDPKNNIPLRSPMAHEIAAAIRAMQETPK